MGPGPHGTRVVEPCGDSRPSTEPATRWQLRNGVYACASADGAVLLDIRRDQYFGFDSPSERALARLVRGWPREADVSASENLLQMEEVLREWNFASLEAEGSPESMDRLPPALARLHSWEEMHASDLRAADLGHFLRAWHHARRLSRAGQLIRAVEIAKRRRTAHRHAVFDVVRGKRIMSAYCHLRAFAFGARGRCLLDSLTLLRFCAAYRLYPRWVIGVRVRPFAAHSWLQHEHWVLNGSPEYVRDYDPILIV